MDNDSDSDEINALFPEDDMFLESSSPSTPAQHKVLVQPSRANRRLSVDHFVAKVKMAQLEGALQSRANGSQVDIQGSLSSDSFNSDEFEQTRSTDNAIARPRLLGTNSLRLTVRMYWVRSRWYIAADVFNVLCSVAVATIYFRMTYPAVSRSHISFPSSHEGLLGGDLLVRHVGALRGFHVGTVDHHRVCRFMDGYDIQIQVGCFFP